MEWTDLTDTERAVAAMCATGSEADVVGWTDPAVRGEALRFMLLGGVTAQPGDRAELRLSGARVQGAFEVEFTEVDVPVTLKRCTVDGPISFYGSHLRRLTLDDCEFAELYLSDATIDGTVAVRGSTSTGLVSFAGATIGGSLVMRGTHLAGPGIAFDGPSLRVRRDLIADYGFTCRGALRLDRAEINGILTLEGAVLDGCGDAAASSLRMPGIARGGLDDGEWSTSVAFSGRHLSARELILLPAQPPGGLFDLRHAKLGLLRDTPPTWPPALRIDGLSYEALADVDERDARLRWLRLDPRGFRPQPYAQLAQVYRAAGRDEDARSVLLAGERHRRDALSRPGRWWGRLQDATVGYGYRPVRAAAWLAALFTVGTIVFLWYEPRAADPGKAPHFVAPVYTLDLILPVGDFGQQSAYHPRGATVWLAYTLIVAGLILATTVAAAATRRLRRT
ncbi:hypothetical protein [Paractinoplanes toevensis]|uniref:Oxidoreductase n=1 Tax=Paractinoplanes toevensis TaxID=571911 RepID=A0A919W8G3_9ACTN|nr:hypothetical protein [Actinoplanes toevensis]GIM93711.1 oxidoreductase [Actinoplanes toevensis]